MLMNERPNLRRIDYAYEKGLNFHFHFWEPNKAALAKPLAVCVLIHIFCLPFDGWFPFLPKFWVFLYLHSSYIISLLTRVWLHMFLWYIFKLSKDLFASFQNHIYFWVVIVASETSGRALYVLGRYDGLEMVFCMYHSTLLQIKLSKSTLFDREEQVFLMQYFSPN